MRHPCCRNFRCYEFKPCTKYTCLSMKKSLRRSHCNVAIPRLPSSFRKWSKLPPASTFLPSFAFLSSSLGTAIIRNTAQGRTVRPPSSILPSVRPPRKSRKNHFRQCRPHLTTAASLTTAAVFLSSRGVPVLQIRN